MFIGTHTKIITTIFLFLIAVTTHAKNAYDFISYSDVGKGEALVLIHPFPTDERIWLPQQQNLKNNFRVISIDLWGFGKSPKVLPKAISMSEYADEVKSLLDQLHIKKAIIGGESMGGYVTLAFLKKYPQHVNGLILAGTEAVAPNPDEAKSYKVSAEEILQHGTEKFVAKFLPKAVSMNASTKTREFLHSIFSTQTATGMAAALLGMAEREDTRSVLSATKLPVLIITGELDEVISPKESVAMHKLATNSKLLVIPNCGHLVNVEQPEVVNKAILSMFG